jgi:putative transposase
VIEQTITKVITCKNCGSTSIVKFGTYKSDQRYYCKDCKRKFKDDNASFHIKKRTQWESSAVYLYFKGMSFKDIRDHLKTQHGYSPSQSLIYGWVDKYTNLARRQFKGYHPKVGDFWLADETMLDVGGQHKV